MQTTADKTQTTADKTQTSEDEYSHSAIAERLISLVDNKKSASVEDSVYRVGPSA